MALLCDVTSVNAVPGSVQEMSDKELQALIILYLYRHKNTSSTGAVPADSLLASAKCLDCGVSDHQLLALEAWIERQAALDAGATGIPATFDSAAARSNINCLTCLPMHSLKAIEMYLRCQLS